MSTNKAPVSRITAAPERRPGRRVSKKVATRVVAGSPRGRRPTSRALVRHATKRREYAKAGIPEYWIVDPQDERVLVLRLAGARYEVHGEFERGAQVASALLPGVELPVDAVLDAK